MGAKETLPVRGAGDSLATAEFHDAGRGTAGQCECGECAPETEDGKACHTENDGEKQLTGDVALEDEEREVR